MKKVFLTLIFIYFISWHIAICWADFVEVEIKGIEGSLKKNVLALLKINHQKKEGHLTSAQIKILFSKGYGEIKKALAPFGYFNPQIKGNLTLKDKERRVWLAQYRVNKGEKVKISEIIFRIIGEGKKRAFFKMPFPLNIGDPFNQEVYEDFKKRLLDIALNNGYLEAEFKKKQVIINPKENSAKIVLIFDTGRQCSFGELSFKNSNFSKEFLKGFADFQRGDPFSRKKLLTFRSRLLDSNYFDSIDFNIKKDSNNTCNIPIEVTPKLKKPNVYKIGLGYISDVGPRITLKWDRRYIGRYGHYLKTKLKFSSEKSLISGEYFIPLGRPYSDYISLKPTIEHYNTDSRVGWQYTVNLIYSKAIGNGWRRNAGLNFGYEDYEVGSDNEDAKEIIPFISFQKTIADNVLYTNRGYSLKFDISGELGGFLAKKTYISSIFQGKFIRRFLDDYRIISRCDMGAILTEDIRELPASRRFYAGGYSSIRGFAFEELGPKNPEDGEIIGGRYLLIASIELERHLFKGISGAIFCDIGNSFDPDYKNRMELGTGFGIRIKSPVGPIRLDFGFGLSQNPIPFKFYLSFGPDL